MLKIRILLFIGVLLAVGLGYVYFTKGAGLPTAVTQKIPFLQNPNEALGVLPNSLDGIAMPSLPTNTTAQLETVKDRTEAVGETVGQVLGEAVKEASPSSSLQERAFDYGRYLYCQQVVKDYEARVEQ